MDGQDLEKDSGQVHRWPASSDLARHALDIFEVLDAILSSAGFSQGDYAQFARVNTLWNHLAEKRVWHTLTIGSLLCLFRLLAPLVEDSDGGLVSS